MDSEVYKFNKSFEERLSDLNSILIDDEASSSSQIFTMWTDFLEMSIEPWGWKALWYISRRCCNQLKITFPALAVVMVDSIEFKELSANVTVTEVEDVDDSENLPTKVKDVPLKELYVMINQEFKGPDYSITAEYLDQYRFFYNHLWWPWDEEESKNENWMLTHFLFRLTLYYEMLQGKMHFVTAKTIKHLVEQGKEIYFKIEDIQNEIDSTSDDEEVVGDRRIIEMINLSNELSSIKSQLSYWENTELRKVLDADIQKNNSNSGVQIIIPECPLDEATKHINQATQCITEKELFRGVIKDLKEALLRYIEGDKIFIVPGVYSICGYEPLAYNVTIKGLYDTKSSTISDSRSSWNLFETIAEHVVFHSLTIEVRFSRAAITVKRGVTYLDLVTIKNSCRNSLEAIAIHKGASLIVTQCNFVNFNIAIICKKGATLHLMDCVFQNNDTCIKIEKGAELIMENCDLKKNKKSPIQLIGSKSSKGHEPLEFLRTFDEIKLSSVKVSDPQSAVEIL